MISRPILLALCACLCFPACKQTDDNNPPAGLDCPTDTTPVKALGGNGFVVLPNAFSPNGDGRNDMFRVVPAGPASLKSMSIRIIATEGSVITTLATPSAGWDGANPTNRQPYPAGRYRVEYGLVLPGGTGPDLAVNGHTCVTLFRSDTSGCLMRQGNMGDYTFPDQIDPATGDAPFVTGEKFCP